MTAYTLKQAGDMLKSKQISATELAQEYLAAIEAGNPAINAYITLDKAATLIEAAAADARIAAGHATALTGVPIAYKDIFCQQGWKSACASKMLDNFVSPYTATVVQNLLNEGMVTLGRTNMDEFAMGSTTESSFYGATKNPWDIENVPGGSSGGFGQRHRRLYPPTGITLRHHRLETHIRRGFPLRHGGLCLQLRSSRADGANR